MISNCKKTDQLDDYYTQVVSMELEGFRGKQLVDEHPTLPSIRVD